MSHRIVTISREFGSGGRSIGRMLAERLGIAYYDKELVKQVSLKTGFDPKYIEDQGEYAPSKGFWSMLLNNQAVPGSMSAADFLWCIQRNVILQLAEEKPCVIVGRCADYILREREDCINAFIYADTQFRAERIVRLYGESDIAPEKRLSDKDMRRRLHYKHYTAQEWGAARNYDICLNTSAIGIERSVDILAQIYLSELTKRAKT